MVSLGKCSGSCNSSNDLSIKICIPSKTKDINVKAFNMISNKNEAKALVKHISSDCKCKFNSKTCNSNQNGIKHVYVNVKIIVSAKKIIAGILAHVFVRIASIKNVLLMIQRSRVIKLYMLCILYQQKWQILYQQMLRVLC